MNKLFLILLISAISFVGFAQNSSKSDRNNPDLRRSINDFNKNIAEENKKISYLNDSIAKVNTTLASTESENKRGILENKIAAFEKQIAEHEKQIAALQAGIARVEEDIAKGYEDNSDSENSQIDNRSSTNTESNTEHTNYNFRGHWAGIDLGFNNFVNKNFSMSMPAGAENFELNFSKSWALSINFLQFSIPLGSNNLGLVTGMGFDFNNYHFRKNIDLLEDQSGVIQSVQRDPSDRKYTKNALNTVFFNVPLLVEIKIPIENSSIHIGAGIIGGVKLDSKTQKYYEVNKDIKEDVLHADYQLFPFRCSLDFRMGYKFLNLHINYSLTHLFLTNKGPEIYPFTIGLTLLYF